MIRAIIAILRTTLPGCGDGPFRQAFKALFVCDKDLKKKVLGHFVSCLFFLFGILPYIFQMSFFFVVYHVVYTHRKGFMVQIIQYVEKISAAGSCDFISAASDIFGAKISGTFKRSCLLGWSFSLNVVWDFKNYANSTVHCLYDLNVTYFFGSQEFSFIRLSCIMWIILAVLT